MLPPPVAGAVNPRRAVSVPSRELRRRSFVPSAYPRRAGELRRIARRLERRRDGEVSPVTGAHAARTGDPRTVLTALDAVLGAKQRGLVLFSRRRSGGRRQRRSH